MKTDTIEKIALQLMDKNDTKAKEIINSEYLLKFLSGQKEELRIK